MSQGGQIAADAVRDMLVGLADALQDAQGTLSEAARTGDAGHGYEIPYLDFAFEVEFHEEAEANQPTRLRLLPKARRDHQETGRETRISSSISGRLATVPSHGGRPETLLDLDVSAVEGRAKRERLDIQVSSMAGEQQGGVPVSLQVDVEMTEQLLGYRPSAQQRLSLLSSQRLTTREDGSAHLVIDLASLRGKQVVVQVESRGAIGRVLLPGDLS
ncbi:hypothetical protein FHR95_000802 [Halomonas fontilapidosi]|uniref:Uncharacterized protein n=1 Tax=Halomonas fontilapidosi TaxID=616675 RepID=A0A7W5GYM4_9GAMM|nr:hypothetical protein [Halomonas fontilapidosi]MBB3183261.1 hypothetical protein [Halomonas fontilapidosi]